MEKYELGKQIGHGNYGTVHLVTHVAERRPYVVKRIPVHKMKEQSEALREAQLLSRLRHPNIIAYKESFLCDDSKTLCIVTAFAEDGDLFTHISRAKAARRYFPERQVLDWVAQIALALDHIHGMRVMHRDLKTQNIFLGRGGVIKLGDFGISRVLERTDDFATTVTGTPYYLSPEVCTNQPYTLKSDVWAFGCVAYEIATLRHAFAADSLLSLVYQIVNGTCPPIPKERYDVRFAKIVARTLERDHRRRPDIATVLQSDLMQEHLRRMQREGLGRPRTASQRAGGAGRPGTAVRRLVGAPTGGGVDGGVERAGIGGGDQRRRRAAGAVAAMAMERGRDGAAMATERGRDGAVSATERGNAPADLSNLTPREAMAERRRRANAERERILRAAAEEAVADKAAARARFIHAFHGSGSQAMPDGGASSSDRVARSSAVGTLDGSGAPSGSPSGSIRVEEVDDEEIEGYDPEAAGTFGSGPGPGLGLGTLDGPPRASTSSRADPSADDEDVAMMVTARDSLEVLGLNPKVGNGAAFVPPKASPGDASGFGAFGGASMAAFEPCFAPPPPAGAAPAPRYAGGGDALSIEMDGTLGGTLDGTLGETATTTGGFRTARAGLDTAEFGRALASPEKPSFPSALSPPMSPEHVKAEHDVLAALTLEAEIDADADADAARVAEHAARHTPRGAADARGDAEGHVAGVGRSKMLPPPSTRSATVRHNSWTAEIDTHEQGTDDDEDDEDDDEDDDDDSSPSDSDYTYTDVSSDEGFDSEGDEAAVREVLDVAAKSLGSTGDAERIGEAIDANRGRPLARAGEGGRNPANAKPAARSPGRPASRPEPDQTILQVRANNVERLRSMCAKQLGDAFGPVHEYLRGVRRKEAAAAAAARTGLSSIGPGMFGGEDAVLITEDEIKTSLLRLVRGDERKLQACFAVDMLCFEERSLEFSLSRNASASNTDDEASDSDTSESDSDSDSSDSEFNEFGTIRRRRGRAPRGGT